MNERFPFTYPLAFAWTLSTALLLSILIQGSVVLRPSSAYDIVQLGAIEALVFVIGIFGVVRLHGGAAALGSMLGLRPTNAGLVALGAALGFTVHYPAEFIAAWIERLYPMSEEEQAAQAALLSAGSPGRLVVLLLVVACVGPLVEELFFRGALYGFLRQSHRMLGSAAITAVCFVIGHLEHRLWPPLLVVAAAMTHLRAVSGSLLPSIAAHVVFNAVTVVGVASGAGNTQPTDVRPAVSLAGSAATLGIVFAIQVLSMRSKTARRARAEDAE